MDTYAPVRCPSCGSKSILPSDGKYYCRSCDGFFEQTKVGVQEESPQQVQVPPVITPEMSEETKVRIMLGILFFSFIAYVVVISIIAKS